MTRATHALTAAMFTLGAWMPIVAQDRAPADQKKNTTIVGCLVQGATPASSGFFIRTPVVTVPVGSQVAVGGSGSAPGRATTSAGAPDSTTLYRIAGMDITELEPHLGHRVEFAGTLTTLTPTTKVRTKQDPTTGRVTVAVDEDWTVAGELHAESLKVIAMRCQ